MQFTVKFNMDNSAFDENAEAELQRILMEIINQLGQDSGAIKDINGNVIGEWTKD